MRTFEVLILNNATQQTIRTIIHATSQGEARRVALLQFVNCRVLTCTEKH